MGVAVRDSELLGLVQRGDPAAQERLLDHWLPVVVRWCARLGGPRVDPEDAAQDVFLVVIRRLDRVYDADRFPAWLFGITRRVLARHRRRAWFRRWVPGVRLEMPDLHGGPARLLDVSEAGRAVQAVLEDLPPVEREVLVLCLLEERTDREVALLLDIPSGTVKSRLRRARQRFLAIARERNLDVHLPDGGAP